MDTRYNFYKFYKILETRKVSAMTTAEVNGVLEHLDPRVLELEDNVRDDAGLTKAFLASITEHGVLVPITAVRENGGAVRVRTGKRRTLAAQQVGLASVPVYVLTADGSDDTVERVVEQIVENDHRAELTEVQRLFGIQQILDAGLSVTKTAKQLSVPPATVKAAKAVGESQEAIDALAHGQVSLAEAATIAEFDGNEYAMERLLRAAGTNRFEQVAGEVRAAVEQAAEQRRAEAVWAERGYAILTQQPASFDPEAVPLHSLLHPDGTDAVVADVTTPAHWAVLLGEDSVFTDKETGEVVAEDAIDWGTESRPEETPDEGLRHFDTVIESTGFVPEYYCVDYTAAGLVPDERYVRMGGVANFPGLQVDDDSGLTPAERASIEANASDADSQKRERRKVLALNRLGEAAQEVRRDFVIRLLSRKSAPKGAAVFVATTLASDGYLLTNYKANEVTTELLGARKEEVTSYGTNGAEYVGGVRQMIADLPPGADGRASVITLGLVLAALEARTPKDAWRHQSGYNRAAGPGEYLGFLVEQGYALAPVEEVITGAKTADEVYDAWLDDA